MTEPPRAVHGSLRLLAVPAKASGEPRSERRCLVPDGEEMFVAGRLLGTDNNATRCAAGMHLFDSMQTTRAVANVRGRNPVGGVRFRRVGLAVCHGDTGLTEIGPTAEGGAATCSAAIWRAIALDRCPWRPRRHVDVGPPTPILEPGCASGRVLDGLLASSDSDDLGEAAHRRTLSATILPMTDEPPIIKLDVNATDAAAARALIKGMLETGGTEYQIELPEDTDELGRLILALAHEAALLAIQVHHDHPDMSAVRIVEMLATSEPRRGLRVVGPDDTPWNEGGNAPWCANVLGRHRAYDRGSATEPTGRRGERDFLPLPVAAACPRPMPRAATNRAGKGSPHPASLLARRLFAGSATWRRMLAWCSASAG
jgi:hypothetical protein